MVDKIQFHKRFLDIFTDKELNVIVNNATVVTENCIMINTTNNFFELSADIGGKLYIYCNSNENDTEQQLTKDEFMKLYKSSPLLEMKHINIDD